MLKILYFTSGLSLIMNHVTTINRTIECKNLLPEYLVYSSKGKANYREMHRKMVCSSKPGKKAFFF